MRLSLTGDAREHPAIDDEAPEVHQVQEGCGPAILIAVWIDENALVVRRRRIHSGAGAPVEVYGVGASGACYAAASAWVCLLAEVPPGGACWCRYARRGSSVELLFERVAGLDVGKASVTVCVRTP